MPEPALVLEALQGQAFEPVPFRGESAPLVLGSGVALFRAEALVMPLALVFAWLPVRRAWPLIATAAFVCPVIAAQFFLNALR